MRACSDLAFLRFFRIKAAAMAVATTATVNMAMSGMFHERLAPEASFATADEEVEDTFFPL